MVCAASPTRTVLWAVYVSACDKRRGNEAIERGEIEVMEGGSVWSMEAVRAGSDCMIELIISTVKSSGGLVRSRSLRIARVDSGTE